MRRLLAPLVPVVLIALGLSACQVSLSPGAARIGSQSISKATLNDAVTAVADDAAFVCVIAAEASASSSSISIKGVGVGTYNTDFTDSQLTEIIKQRIVAALVAKMGIAAAPAAQALARERFDGGVNPPSGSSCTESGTQAVNDLASSYRTVLLSLETNLDLLATHLAGVPFTVAGLESYAAAHEATSYDDCVSAIVTTTNAAAVSARSAIESGQSFAAVAKADSKDPDSAPDGGALGCLPVSEFNSPLNADLAALPVATVSQPVAFSSDYVLLEITSRQAPTSLEALNALVTSEATAVDGTLTEAESTTRVSVDPAYGAWRDESGNYEVVPPSGPASSYLPDPTAITPPTVPLG